MCTHTYTPRFTPVYTPVPVHIYTHAYQYEQYAEFSFQQLFEEKYTRWDWVCYTTEQPAHQKVIINESIMGAALARGWLLVLPDGPWRNSSSSRAESRHRWAVAR